MLKLSLLISTLLFVLLNNGVCSVPLSVTRTVAIPSATNVDVVKDAMVNNGFYYYLTNQGFYYISSSKFLESSALTNDGSYTVKKNLYYIYPYNNTNYNALLVDAYGISRAQNNQIGAIPDLTYTSGFQMNSVNFASGGSNGDNQYIVGFDYPYSLAVLVNSVKTLSSTIYTNTIPTDLVCDFSALKCFLVAVNYLDIYNINVTPPSRLDSVTLAVSGVRVDGIVNTLKQYVYYYDKNAKVLEAYSYQGDLAFSVAFPNTGAYKGMAFDSIQGVLFIVTTTEIISVDWEGKNQKSILTVATNTAIKVDVLIGSETTDNDNYVLITRSDNNIMMVKYESNCQNNCNGNGYCTYGVCNCPNGGNSTCGYTVSSASSTITDNYVGVVLVGEFANSIPSDFKINVGSTLIDSNDIKSVNSSHIVFNLLSIPDSTSIKITMNGQIVLFQPVNLYGASLNNLVQENSYLLVSGGPFSSIYKMKAILISENNVEVQGTFFNSTHIKFVIDGSTSPQLELNVDINGEVDKTFNIILSPAVTSLTPTNLKDTGNILSVAGYFLGDAPKVWVDDKIVDFTDLKIQLQAGYYSNFVIGNGFKNATVPLTFAPLSISNVEQSDLQKLTIQASNFGINQADVQVTLSGEQLTISGFDYQNGIINVALTDSSTKGELVVIARETKSIMVNLKPNITSIAPINPSYDGETITITGLYLSTNVELTNSDSVKSTLVCSSLTSTSISCQIPRGTGSFSLTSISSHQGGVSLSSNIYQSTYKTKPNTSSSSDNQEEPNTAQSLHIHSCLILFSLLIVLII